MQKLDFFFVMPTIGNQSSAALRVGQSQPIPTDSQRFNSLVGLLGSALTESLSRYTPPKNFSPPLTTPKNSNFTSKNEVISINPAIQSPPISNYQNKQEKNGAEVKSIKSQNIVNEANSKNQKDVKETEEAQSTETSKKRPLSKISSPQKKEKSKKNTSPSSSEDKILDIHLWEATIPMLGSLKKRKIIMKRKKLLKRQVENWQNVTNSFKGKREVKGLHR